LSINLLKSVKVSSSQIASTHTLYAACFVLQVYDVLIFRPA